MRYLLCLCLSCCLGVSAVFSAEPVVVRHVGPEDVGDIRKNYFIGVLHLTLEESASKVGPYEMKQIQAPMSQGRAFKSLQEGLVDVVWSMTSEERETNFRAIRIPLMQGLIGYRVLVIRKEDRYKFNAITEPEQLKALLAYQGHDWPDAQILQANGYRLNTSSWYKGLFKLLAQGGFDYFPRSVLEAWDELAAYDQDSLMVEESILLHYPTAVYFFVRREDVDLAERIRLGLRNAIDNGKFERLLYGFEPHRRALQAVDFKHRRIFQLHNPLLTEQTPLDDESLWFDVEAYVKNHSQ
ncbi:transporter substrate-binding domain-containing protein [Hahella sp. HN01]|uniref:transporter substrate-binding domain-containing protein n=1 Tax=Hahella sp. HN01 TaxID=2847262 RepID=UPI001C1EA185|nr:transporter substrate-binding domain-containing protein [Hahella sp. HN01]